MNKPTISESLSKSISENSKLVAEQAVRISKSLPKTNFAELTAPKIGKLTLGNTSTHQIECFFVAGHSWANYC